MSSVPEKAEITQIFKRLRSNAANKLCFDCRSKNPTWSSVTYGIFICIDCSGIHRGMGVHLTFVRSTQLDSNWTWQQLRQMQLGGNENATTFFRQHNVDTTDILQKYKSRAAQLYRDKLHHIATQALRLHGTKLFIDKLERRISQNSSEGGGDNADDFFDHDSHKVATIEEVSAQKNNIDNGTACKPEQDGGVAPSVEAALTMSPTQAQESLGTRKPTIGQRKPAKKGGLGAKKGGLGAQKVKKDFSEIEKEAAIADQIKYKVEEDRKIDEAKRIEDDAKNAANMRLAYQDLSMQQKKQEEKLRNIDAKKAAQVERLGMGAASSKGAIGHSVMNQMNTIVQEEPLANKGFESRNSSRAIEDDFEVISSDWRSASSFGSKSKNENAFTGSNNNGDDEFFDGFGGSSSKSSNNWEKEFEVMKLGSDRSSSKISAAATSGTSNWSNSFEDSKANESRSFRSSRTAFNTTPNNVPAQEDAVKKFGSAKAISSDMYFGDQSNNGNEGNGASRFTGQSSISSAEYFNRPDELTYAQKYGAYGPGITTPDMEDVKDSVKQGVSKVAGRLSGMASGVMTQLQDKYGY